jgi:hypothetical protein
MIEPTISDILRKLMQPELFDENDTSFVGKLGLDLGKLICDMCNSWLLDKKGFKTVLSGDMTIEQLYAAVMSDEPTDLDYSRQDFLVGDYNGGGDEGSVTFEFLDAKYLPDYALTAVADSNRDDFVDRLSIVMQEKAMRAMELYSFDGPPYVEGVIYFNPVERQFDLEGTVFNDDDSSLHVDESSILEEVLELSPSLCKAMEVWTPDAEGPFRLLDRFRTARLAEVFSESPDNIVESVLSISIQDGPGDPDIDELIVKLAEAVKSLFSKAFADVDYEEIDENVLSGLEFKRIDDGYYVVQLFDLESRSEYVSYTLSMQESESDSDTDE